MPWKVCKPMDERLKFIARLLDGEKMAVACRDFGISRKTGYKILTRYNEIGLDGLTDCNAAAVAGIGTRIELVQEFDAIDAVGNHGRLPARKSTRARPSANG